MTSIATRRRRAGRLVALLVLLAPAWLQAGPFGIAGLSLGIYQAWVVMFSRYGESGPS